MSTLINPFLDAYKVAAGEGAAIELKMRLLANKIPALRGFACAKNLEDVESHIVCHFAGELSEYDCQTLRLCRQLRNKLLHCDFHAARNRLNELNVPSGQGGVRQMDVSGLSGHQIEERIGAVVSGARNIARPIADASSTKDGGIYGWLLELGCADDFTKVIEAFKAAAVIVARLIESTEKSALDSEPG